MNASVIVPSYNSCERLYYNLTALNHQDYPKNDFEVVVVDNCSTDDTYKMLSEFVPQFRLKKIRLEKNLGRAGGRNAGIINSEGRLLIFHDSDMLVPSDYVSKHVMEHKNENTAVCGMFWGRIFTYFYRDFSDIQKYYFSFAKSQYKIDNKDLEEQEMLPLINTKQIDDGSFIKYGAMDMNTNPFKATLDRYGESLTNYKFPWKFFITNNCSAPKKLVEKVGMFDENFLAWGGEDYDLGYRLYKAGCRFAVKNHILSLHQEHPAYSSSEHNKNSFYLCDKYDEIDMLLFLFCKNTSIDQESMNDIIAEIEEISAIKSFDGLIEVFRQLLIITRNRARAYLFEDNKDAFKQKCHMDCYPNIDLAMIKQQSQELMKLLGQSTLVNAINALYEDIFDVKN